MKNKGVPYLIIVFLVGLLFLILDEREVFLALLSKFIYSGTRRAIFISILNLAGYSGRLAPVLFFVVKAAEIFYSMDDAGPSSGACSKPGNPVVPPVDLRVDEVNQDELWNALETEELRKEKELMDSREWKESESHLLKVENLKKSLGQRAKEIAQERGLNPGRCEAVEDAAKHIAEDAEDLPEKQQLRFLVNLMRDLNNPNSELWERIEEEVKRWRSWED